MEGGTVSSCHCEWAKWREGEAWKEKEWVEQVEGGRGSKKRRGRVTGRKVRLSNGERTFANRNSPHPLKIKHGETTVPKQMFPSLLWSVGR